MASDKKDYNLILEEESIIKNICYDNESGKLILIDNKNNHFLCDIFGRKKKFFLPNISGIANPIERKNYPLTSRNSDPKKSLKELFTSNNKLSDKKKFIDYFPTTRRLEGYSKFPRPIVPPYSNLPSYQKIERNRPIIQNCLSQHFSNEKNKKYIERKNQKKGLSFLTYNLNEVDTLKFDSQKLLKLIEDTYDECKEKYKYKIDILKTNPLIKALNKFKKYINENKNMTFLNGRKLDGYNPKIKEEYNIIYNTLKFNTLTNDIRNRNIFKLKKKTSFSENKKIPILKIGFLQNSNTINFNKNNLYSSRDLTLGKKIKMNFGLFSYEEEAKKKNEKVNEIEAYLDKDNNNKELKNKENKIISSKEINNIVNQEENVNKQIKENDISFISILSEKEKADKKILNNFNIKTINKLKIINEDEKNLLKGFIKEEPKLEKYIIKLLKPKLKTNGQHYIEDLEILKKTNPFIFKMEEKNEKRNLKQLKKKINALKINANNALKVKFYNKK